MKIGKHNSQDYRKEFEETGTVVIRNFLDEELAETLYNFFNHEMPDEWWSVANFVPGREVVYTRNTPENKEYIKHLKSDADKAFNDNSQDPNFIGGLVYHFYRTVNDHLENCWCKECDFKKQLTSPEMLDFLEGVSGERYSRTFTTFTSKYSEGCFLSPHTDESNGDIGFTLQLTKNWKPQWGGNLHLMNDEGTIIEKTEVPTFNSLTLFRLPEKRGKWHYVSHINPGVTQSRIAYTGWFLV